MSAGFFRYYLGRAGIKITQKSYGDWEFFVTIQRTKLQSFLTPVQFWKDPPNPSSIPETNSVISGPEVLGSKPFRPRVDS